MLMEDFKDWKSHRSRLDFSIMEDEDVFKMFCGVKFKERDLVDIIKCLAYEVYELQVCMEGILEDQSEAWQPHD